jgi:hypothetical protein
MASPNTNRMTREEQLYLAAIINANRHQKLHELGHLIKGTPAGTAPPTTKTKGASSSIMNIPRKPGYLERRVKLKDLSKMIKGL